MDAHIEQMKLISDTQISRLGLTLEPEDVGMDPSALESAMLHDVIDYMPGDILTKIDRASMAHSLELRAPFLDVAVAEFLLALPATLKLNREEDKIILRRTFSADWPDSVQNRRKQGFGGPMDEWLKNGRLIEYFREVVLSPNSALSTLLDFDVLRQFVKSSTSLQQWTLLCLGIWLDQNPSVPATASKKP